MRLADYPPRAYIAATTGSCPFATALTYRKLMITEAQKLLQKLLRLLKRRYAVARNAHVPPCTLRVTRPILGARSCGASPRLFKIVPDDFVSLPCALRLRRS